MEQHSDASVWSGPLVAALVRIVYSKAFRKCFKSSGPVVFVSSRLCIKSTMGESKGEASAMKFVRQNTSIPVPKVYHVCEYKGRRYIVMERIKGSKIAINWLSRSEESKQRLLHQLRDFVEELRRIPPPKDTGVCNADHGPIFDMRLPHQNCWGPFSSIREFHLALLDGHDFTLTSCDSFPGLKELSSFFNQPSGQPVFTHGDLSSLNILCRGDEVVGIVDWETAGWFPYYWEYVTAWKVNPYNTFWQDEVDKFLEPLPYEREMDSVREKYFGDIPYPSG